VQTERRLDAGPRRRLDQPAEYYLRPDVVDVGFLQIKKLCAENSHAGLPQVLPPLFLLLQHVSRQGCMPAWPRERNGQGAAMPAIAAAHPALLCSRRCHGRDSTAQLCMRAWGGGGAPVGRGVAVVCWQMVKERRSRAACGSGRVYELLAPGRAVALVRLRLLPCPCCMPPAALPVACAARCARGSHSRRQRTRALPCRVTGTPALALHAPRLPRTPAAAALTVMWQNSGVGLGTSARAPVAAPPPPAAAARNQLAPSYHRCARQHVRARPVVCPMPRACARARPYACSACSRPCSCARGAASAAGGPLLIAHDEAPALGRPAAAAGHRRRPHAR